MVVVAVSLAIVGETVETWCAGSLPVLSPHGPAPFELPPVTEAILFRRRRDRYHYGAPFTDLDYTTGTSFLGKAQLCQLMMYRVITVTTSILHLYTTPGPQRVPLSYITNTVRLRPPSHKCSRYRSLQDVDKRTRGPRDPITAQIPLTNLTSKGLNSASSGVKRALRDERMVVERERSPLNRNSNIHSRDLYLTLPAPLARCAFTNVCPGISTRSWPVSSQNGHSSLDLDESLWHLPHCCYHGIDRTAVTVASTVLLLPWHRPYSCYTPMAFTVFLLCCLSYPNTFTMASDKFRALSVILVPGHLRYFCYHGTRSIPVNLAYTVVLLPWTVKNKSATTDWSRKLSKFIESIIHAEKRVHLLLPGSACTTRAC
ncbi:hypothetical protein BaRGS_00012204 [Batillaria attramentaria]|uniref:Uncharacterized protein n=1 Tax=Batillaria attramentaria TaxID=370345 RepID=A0ABD0LB01_9CAEN